jgi:type II secretory pathway predicted ATPase ExeA
MHDAYWGLQRPVFTPTAARQSLAASPVHAEALARLDFLCESRSPFGLLLGPSGSGKSTVLVEFAERATRGGALVALASAAAADETSVLTPLQIGLQGSLEDDARGLWRQIIDRFEEIKLEGLPVIVLLDDLDKARPDVLLLVERLLAVGGPALTVVATARVQTASKIGQRLLDLAALRIDLAPWNEKETSEYLSGTLANAGRQQPAFDEAATRRLFELSGGAPRKVNQLAQLALLAGASQKLIQIDEATVEAVQEELSLAR